MVSLLLFVVLKVRPDCIKFENCCLTLTPCTLWNQPVMHSPDTFLNILSNLIFLNALRSTHNAFAIYPQCLRDRGNGHLWSSPTQEILYKHHGW